MKRLATLLTVLFTLSLLSTPALAEHRSKSSDRNRCQHRHDRPIGYFGPSAATQVEVLQMAYAQQFRLAVLEKQFAIAQENQRKKQEIKDHRLEF